MENDELLMTTSDAEPVRVYGKARLMIPTGAWAEYLQEVLRLHGKEADEFRSLVDRARKSEAFPKMEARVGISGAPFYLGEVVPLIALIFACEKIADLEKRLAARRE